jgi:type I restriction enzyme, S subunit
LIRVRLVGELVSDYVNVFLSSERGRRELLRRVTTSAGNHNINSNSIRLLLIPVPRHIEFQNEVVQLATASRQVAKALNGKLLAFETLKKSLMHDLLTGTVRVNRAPKSEAVA